MSEPPEERARRLARRRSIVEWAQQSVAQEVERAQRTKLEAEQETARQAHLRRLEGPIPLVAGIGGIVLGTDVDGAGDVSLPVKKLRHMLICGTTGSGKSTYIHSLLHQLVRSITVDALYLVDLKAGLELAKYAREFPNRAR